jgi:hypothetical protein
VRVSVDPEDSGGSLRTHERHTLLLNDLEPIESSGWCVASAAIFSHVSFMSIIEFLCLKP